MKLEPIEFARLIARLKDLARVEYARMEDVGEHERDDHFPHATDEVRLAPRRYNVLLEQLHVDELVRAEFDVAIDEILPPDERDEHECDGKLPFHLKRRQDVLEDVVHCAVVA